MAFSGGKPLCLARAARFAAPEHADGLPFGQWWTIGAPIEG